MPILNIDSSALRGFTHKLENISRAALPVAIRQTLNDAAYDVKLRTMPETSDLGFIKRKPSFWRAKSRVESAKGLDVKNMQATVGFQEGVKHSQAVRDLVEQEFGGRIDDKDFIALDEARISGSNRRVVKKKNELGEIDPVFNTTNWSGTLPKKWQNSNKIRKNIWGGKAVSNKQKFYTAALRTKVGGYFLGPGTRMQTLYRLDDIYYSGGKIKFKATKLYTFDRGRKVGVKPKHFMQHAAEKSAERLDEFFIKNATKQINKVR